MMRKHGESMKSLCLINIMPLEIRVSGNVAQCIHNFSSKCRCTANFKTQPHCVGLKPSVSIVFETGSLRGSLIWRENLLACGNRIVACNIVVVLE